MMNGCRWIYYPSDMIYGVSVPGPVYHFLLLLFFHFSNSSSVEQMTSISSLFQLMDETNCNVLFNKFIHFKLDKIIKPLQIRKITKMLIAQQKKP